MSTPTADSYNAPSGSTLVQGGRGTAPSLTLSLIGSVVAGSAATGSVTNNGATPVNWSLSSSPTAAINPSSGTLAAGASVSVTVTPATAGTYSVTLTSAGAALTGSPASLTASAPGVPSWLAAKAVNEWFAVPNSTLQGSAAWLPMPTPGYFGLQTGYVNAENGLGLDESTSTLYLFGGGHSDYSGNELGSFRLAAESPGWASVVGRSDRDAITAYGTGTSSPWYLDGRPASRHTYQGTHFITKLNKYFAAGGFSWPNAGGTGEPVTFNMATGQWEPQGTWTTGPSSNGIYAKHPVTEDIYFAPGGGFRFYKLDTSARTWTTITEGLGTNYTPYFECGTIDTARNALVYLTTKGGPAHNAFRCARLDLNTGAITQIGFNASAALTAFQALDTNHGGLHYDPEGDCYYYYFGGTIGGVNTGGRVWKIVPNSTTTWDISELTMAGATVPAGTGVANGNILTRFRYIPSLRAVIALPSATAPMYMARVA